VLLGAMAGTAGPGAQPIAYPAAPRQDVADDYHGTRVPDPYRWLERTEDPRTAGWLRAEAKLTRAYLDGLPGRGGVERRLTALWDYARTEVPWREAGRLFYLETTGSRPQAALYVQGRRRGPPRAVLDPNTMFPDGSTQVRDPAVSPDGRLVSYVEAPGGADVGRTRVRLIGTGRDLPDVVHGASTTACWTRDSAGFFYFRSPEPGPEAPGAGASLTKRLYYHVVGQPQSRDRRVQEWPDAKWTYCMASEDGRWSISVAEKGSENEIFVADLGDPSRPNVAAPRVRLLGDRRGLHTPIDVVGETLYLLTDLDAARKRIVALDLAAGSAAVPRSIVPESPEVLIDAAVAGDRLVVHYLSDVRSRLRLYDLEGRPVGEVRLPGIGAVGWPLYGRPSSPELFYSFASFLAPPTVYRCDPPGGESVPFRPPRTPFDARGYETTQVFFSSKDGTRVPVFVTAPKGLKRDGTSPALLTGYGGYGASIQPAYRPDIPFWLERGGVYAVANLRGGGEYGEEWHRAGMLEHKQNTFDDFIAVAESLVGEGYTSPGKLAVYGHSNGGLLVGAVVTQRPDLFAAAVGNAGHYDMLRYPLFTAGAAWIPEYGSPQNEAAFRYLLAYSPLHNVRPGTCYPATLLLAADHDDRVVPTHSFKFAAALQAAQTCDRPILLRVASNASHSYSSTRAEIAESTDMWTFLIERLGGRRHGPGPSRVPGH
jgi:prolyl oligopeptidase